MKVLLSAPRAGSSYYYDVIEPENLQLPDVSKPHKIAEFLNPDVGNQNIHEKISWLNCEKEKGNHYTFKHHINYLITNEYDYYNDWFVDFYQYDEILILKRKDWWAWALSFMWQELVGWKTAGIVGSYNPVSINTNVDLTKSLDQFFSIIMMLEKASGTTVYYEDILGQPSKYVRLSNIENYEQKMTDHNIDLVALRNYYEEKKASAAKYIRL